MKELDQLGCVDEFGVGMCAGFDEVQDVFGGEYGESVR